MRRHLWAMTAAMLLFAGPLAAAPPKHKRPPAPPPLPPLQTAAVPVTCPDALGQGVKSGRVFCEIAVSHDPAHGNAIALPPHQGAATVRFHLHNRQIISPSVVRANRAYSRATATVVIVSPDGTILGRGTVRTEFRREADAFDRVAAGAGASGMKAIAPVGDETIEVRVPETVGAVVVVGEKLSLVQVDTAQVLTADGAPVGLMSSAQVEYRPAPVKPPSKAPPKKKPPVKKTVAKPKH
jgi:hypothetical protein